MRIPRSWDDKSLLKDEPFLSIFAAHSLEQLMPRNKSAVKIKIGRVVEDVMVLLKKQPNHLKVVQAWLVMAFDATGERKKIRSPIKKHNIPIFIEFYWHLHHNGLDAMNFLKIIRKNLGYTHFPTRNDTEQYPRQPIRKLKDADIEEQKPCPQLPRAQPSRPDMLYGADNSKTELDARQIHSGISSESKCVDFFDSPTQTKLQKDQTLSANSLQPSLTPAPLPAVVKTGTLSTKLPKFSKKRSLASTAALPNPKRLASGSGPIPVPAIKEEEPTRPLHFESVPSVTRDFAPSKRTSLDPRILSTHQFDSFCLPKVSTASTSTVDDTVMKLEFFPYSLDYKSGPLKGEDAEMDLTTNVPHIPRPPLPTFPPIWAQSRQEVCESFDWFRSYQGGVYFAKNVVKGYLLSGFSSRRDRFEHGGRLIISHGGGKAESLHSKKGQISAQQAEDQLAEDKSVRALLRNYRDGRPLVLLIDDKYALFPYDLGSKEVTYAILGFYVIVNAWAEYQPSNNDRGRVVRYKFAFQWCEGQGDPWWIAADQNSGQPESSLAQLTPALHTTCSLSELKSSRVSTTIYSPSELLIQECATCLTKSPQVYSQTWACLNPSCIKFWNTANGDGLLDVLDYNPDFLKLSSPVSVPDGYENLKPSLPAAGSKTGITTNYAFSRGWHCSKCGRLSCRYKWEQWECANCLNFFRVQGKIRLAKEFWSQTVPANFKDHHIAEHSEITQKPSFTYSHSKGTGLAQTFILPHNRGFIHHIQSGTPAARVDADSIFHEYQEQASSGVAAFRRWPLRAHKCRGPLLSNYFSQNSGEPYQYVGGAANTVPFSEAPSAIIKARDLIQDRIYQALGKRPSFNEVLSAAYMERQKMAFHSDNEIGLGPMVAGLSLGAPALMHFRLHHKHDPDGQQRGTAMTFVLRHGDVLVMEGERMQEYYEHTVIPTNFRIAATARSINTHLHR